MRSELQAAHETETAQREGNAFWACHNEGNHKWLSGGFFINAMARRQDARGKLTEVCHKLERFVFKILGGTSAAPVGGNGGLSVLLPAPEG